MNAWFPLQVVSVYF